MKAHNSSEEKQFNLQCLLVRFKNKRNDKSSTKFTVHSHMHHREDTQIELAKNIFSFLLINFLQFAFQ